MRYTLMSLMWLMAFLLISQLDEIMAEPVLSIEGMYVRNYRTAPNTIEMRHDSRWKFACYWNRRNASQNPLLAISVPSQIGGQINCQFSMAGRPPQCTPSSVQFPASNGNQNPLSSNITCVETGNSLSCSINLEGFNSHHIGLWSCRSISDARNDSILLQYYDLLTEAHLELASWDPIEPTNETGSTDNSTLGNRFECFTTRPVIPPARLAFYLGGVELTPEQTRYPVEWLGDTDYSQEPRMYTLNATMTALISPTGYLSLNQQKLFSNRVLRMRLRRSYNSLLLECRATQELIVSSVASVRSIMLHLDPKGSNSNSSPCGNKGCSLPWLLGLCATILAAKVRLI